MKSIKLINILSPILIIGTTILVILFSRGWRLDLNEKTVVSTGILDISSDPKGTAIYLNGERKGKTPTIIDSLTPGIYQLELRKDFYTTWTKEIQIKEEYVTQITANLFEEGNELTQISDSPLKNIIYSKTGGEALAIYTQNGDQGIWKLQLDQSFFQLEKSKIKIADLIETDLFDLLTTTYELIPNDDFSKALLKTSNTDKTSQRYFLLDLQSEKGEIIEITEFFSDIQQYNWTPENNSIALSKDTNLFIFNTNDLSLTTISNWSNNIWTTSEKEIYFINKNQITGNLELFKSLLDGSEREKLTLIEDSYEISSIKSIYYINEYDELIITLAENTHLLKNKLSESKLLSDNSLQLINISPDNRFIILLDTLNQNHYYYDFEEEVLSEFQKEEITENNLKDFIWSPNGLKLFYRYTENNINKIISIDYDGTNFYELSEFENYDGLLNNNLGFSSDSKTIYIPLPVSTEDISSDQIEEEEISIKREEYIFKLELR